MADSPYDNMPDAVGQMFGKWDRDSGKHLKFHIMVGFAVAIIAVFLLVIHGLTTGSWNQVLFNISLILVALLLPLHEHDVAHASILNMYWAVLLGAAVGSFFVSGTWFNPATLNMIFGGLFVMALQAQKSTDSYAEKALWMVVFIALLFYAIWVIPWAQVPAGPVQDAGMTAKAGLQPLANLVIAIGDALEYCVRDPSSCAERIQELWDALIQFLMTIPGGQLVVDLLVYLSERGLFYSNTLNCIGGKGGLSGIAYDTDPSDPDATPPYQEAEECFQGDEGPSEGGDGDPGGGLVWQQLEVRSGTAVLTFDKTIDGSSVSAANDFSISDPAGSMGISGGSASGSTVRLSISQAPSGPPTGPGDSGGDSVSTGTRITVSITGSISGTDGATLSSGTCSDGYADGDASSC